MVDQCLQKELEAPPALISDTVANGNIGSPVRAQLLIECIVQGQIEVSQND